MFNVNGYVLLSHSRCKQHETTETELLVTTLTVSITLQLSSNVSSVKCFFGRLKNTVHHFKRFSSTEKRLSDIKS